MSYWANRKFNELKNYAVYVKSRCIENKENLPDPTNSDSDVSKATVKYLYVDPKFVHENVANNDSRRIKAGQYQQEVYYDCKEDAEEKFSIDLSCQGNFSMNDVINEIENPKEFKRALKQLVFNSNNLYRAFRQAYCKTKKSRKTPIKNSGRKCKYCLKCGGEKMCQQQKDRGDMLVKDKENVEVPQQNNPILIKNNNSQQEKSSCHMYNSCNTLDAASQCNSVNKSLDNQLVTQTKRPEVETQTVINCVRQDAPCSLDTNANIPNVREKVESQQSKNVQTEEPVNNCQKCQPAVTPTSVAVTTVDKGPKPVTLISSTNPISLTIPLKLQIDSRGGKLRFLDFENKTAASSSKTTQNAIQQTNPPELADLPNRPCFMQEKPQGPLTCSRNIPKSGLIEPVEATPVRQLEKDIAETQPQVSQIGKSATTVPTTIATAPKLIDMPTALEKAYPTDPKPIQNNYVTPEKSTEAAKAPTPIPATESQSVKFTNASIDTATKNDSAPKLEQLKLKAERLRAELLEEMLLTLEQNPPAAAIRTFQRDKRFSQVSDDRSAYSADIVRPARYSLPSNYKVIKELEEQTPLHFAPISNGKAEAITQLEAPLEPLEPPEPYVTAPTGRINRNKKRCFIQDKFNELLRPDVNNFDRKYSKEQRDEILYDIYKLIHPKDSDLPTEVIRRNALYDISLIVEPEPTVKRASLTPSQENFLEDIRHILNPKAIRRPGTLGKKYRKEIKDKILEDLQIILTKDDTPADQQRREQIVKDIRALLEQGIAKSVSLHAHAHAHVQPSTSRMHRSKHQLAPKEPQPISGSLINDLIYKLDSTLNVNDGNQAKEGQSKKNKPHTGKRRSTQSVSSQD